MKTSARCLVALALPGLLALACTKQLPPPETPPSVWNGPVPTATRPVPSGHGEVVIDVTNGAAGVVALPSADAGDAGTATVVCTTPCTATLPLGTHVLQLTSVDDVERTSRAQITVGPTRTAYVHSLGTQRSRTAMQVLGVIIALSALTLPLVGIAAETFQALLTGEEPDLTPYFVVSAVTVGLGLGITFGFPSERQSGSGVQFAMPAAPQP